MDVFDYLNQYQNTSFKEKRFNEIDALIVALLSYVPYDELGLKKGKAKAKDILELVNSYFPPHGTSQRKINYIHLLEDFCNSKRFGDAVFAYFRKERDPLNDKQFQAICISFNQNLYISFCGTDATTLGWKEDFNMSFLETVPSEVEAAKYVNFIAEKFWFKKIYLLGHSKGGRLAITAAKNLKNKRRLGSVYSYDGPNFPPSCYNQSYKEIDSHIHSYAPNESIIGRLMPEYRSKKIICSKNSLLMQHDAFSWLIDDSSFVYERTYTDKSTRIVNTINHTLTTYDDETKSLFVESLFDILDRLDVEKLPSEKELLAFFALRLPFIRREWKNTSKEKRDVIKKIIFELFKDYFFGK